LSRADSLGDVLADIQIQILCGRPRSLGLALEEGWSDPLYSHEFQTASRRLRN